MSPPEAKKIIAALANGIDPTTGEVLAAQSTLNNPQVIRALFVALQALDKAAKRSERASMLPENAGQPWSESEDQRLLAAFDAATPLGALATTHNRTQGAIAARLVRLGRIKERNEAYTRA